MPHLNPPAGFAALLIALAVPSLRADVTLDSYVQFSRTLLTFPSLQGGPLSTATDQNTKAWTLSTFAPFTSTYISLGGGSIDGNPDPLRSASLATEFTDITADGFTFRGHSVGFAEDRMWTTGPTAVSAQNDITLRFSTTEVMTVTLVLAVTIGSTGGTVDLDGIGNAPNGILSNGNLVFAVPAGTAATGTGVHTFSYTGTLNPSLGTPHELNLSFDQGGLGLPYGTTRIAVVDWTLTVAIPAPAAAAALIAASLIGRRRQA